MKKQILFVDDDAMLLEFYGITMEKESARWEISSAGSGPQALALLRKKKFDVVVSDLRMPGMDGIQLMHEVRRFYPQTSRIILSGISDQEEIARNLETTHQFLAKPARPKELFDTLSRIGKLDAFLLNEKLKSLVGQLNSLPSFPSIYLLITKELNREEPAIEKVADIAIQDPALTAKILQVANSAAFGLAQKVSNPFDAIQFIGLNAVRSIALSAHVFDDFERGEVKKISVAQIWSDAMRCARITRLIMRLEKFDDNETEDACTAAMLRNIGKLILAKNLPQKFGEIFNLAAGQKTSLEAAEKMILGTTHAGVAAYLFGLWGLATPMVEAVAFHLQPTESEVRSFSPLTAVHVAHFFTNEFWPDKTSGQPAELNHDYLAAIGVTNKIEHWRNECEKMLARHA